MRSVTDAITLVSSTLKDLFWGSFLARRLFNFGRRIVSGLESTRCENKIRFRILRNRFAIYRQLPLDRVMDAGRGVFVIWRIFIPVG